MKKIPLTQGKVAIVDDDCFEHLNQWKWHAVKVNDSLYYAIRTDNSKKPSKSIRMHREILGCSNPEIFVDHKDHDGLNNKKENLRLCTRTENIRNSTAYGKSKLLGVHFVTNKRKYMTKKGEKISISRKWRAIINVNHKNIHLGYHPCKEDAAKAYNKAALIHFGEFASLNKI